MAVQVSTRPSLLLEYSWQSNSINKGKKISAPHRYRTNKIPGLRHYYTVSTM